MTSRLWPVLPILFAVSERLSSKRERLVSSQDLGTMLHGALLLSAQSVSQLLSPR